MKQVTSKCAVQGVLHPSTATTDSALQEFPSMPAPGTDSGQGTWETTTLESLRWKAASTEVADEDKMVDPQLLLHLAVAIQPVVLEGFTHRLLLTHFHKPNKLGSEVIC